MKLSVYGHYRDISRCPHYRVVSIMEIGIAVRNLIYLHGNKRTAMSKGAVIEKKKLARQSQLPDKRRTNMGHMESGCQQTSILRVVKDVQNTIGSFLYPLS